MTTWKPELTLTGASSPALGNSMGSAHAVILAAVEERIKACLLLDGGFYFFSVPAEIDQLNYVPHLKLRADATIDSHRSNRIVPGWQSRVSLEGETADLLRIG